MSRVAIPRVLLPVWMHIIHAPRSGFLDGAGDGVRKPVLCVRRISARRVFAECSNLNVSIVTSHGSSRNMVCLRVPRNVSWKEICVPTQAQSQRMTKIGTPLNILVKEVHIEPDTVELYIYIYIYRRICGAAATIAFGEEMGVEKVWRNVYNKKTTAHFRAIIHWQQRGI